MKKKDVSIGKLTGDETILYLPSSIDDLLKKLDGLPQGTVLMLGYVDEDGIVQRLDWKSIKKYILQEKKALLQRVRELLHGYVEGNQSDDSLHSGLMFIYRQMNGQIDLLKKELE